MKYQCQECKKAVIVTEEGAVRYCQCEAPIIANMEAEAIMSAQIN